MRITPASVYRNLLYIIGGSLVLYTVYSIVSYDDNGTAHPRRRQKHLFLTVNKDRIGDRFGALAPKKILYWTPIFHSYLPDSIMHECRGIEDRCLLVKDKSLVSSVDAVLFHSADLADTPLPGKDVFRNASQLYVYASMETPHNSGPAALLKKIPSGFFNWTMTYLKTSDVRWKYGPFWIKTREAEKRGYAVTSYHVDKAKLKKTKKGIVGLISNCQTTMQREKAVEELAKHMDVTIGGKCAKNESTANLCPHGKSCDDLIEQYPFFFAIENSICKDYSTEKYWARIHLASIPIVARRSTYASSNAPPKSFIALDDYKSPKAMAEHLKFLETNETAYAEYFAWRSAWTVAPWQTAGYRNGPCLLCEKLWQEAIPEKSYDDVYEWFVKESQCERGEFVNQWIASS